MLDTATASAYLPFKYTPSIAVKAYLFLLAAGLLGSALLAVTGWWRSIYSERVSPLIVALMIGVTSFLVVEAVRNGHLAATWLALIMVVVVLFAGIESTCAMWRELKKPGQGTLKWRKF
jgi:hypothetical protein